MTDFKELREALDRHAAVADPALLKDRQAWEQYRDDAYTIQYWGYDHSLRMLLAELDAARKDAERMALQLLAAANYIDALGGTSKGYRAAIDAMKEQQP